MRCLTSEVIDTLPARWQVRRRRRHVPGSCRRRHLHLVQEGLPRPVAVGFDVAGLAADGRIRAVYGFLDMVPG
ncbi:hypothetical protein ACQEVC_43955 [Plantactinospora sp. CA-294935]|uniref:hypothetical protein n=1 Tax=Plantactinospora sp. CA-294935 TaxID=3240012 RepID=UPI003D92A8F1